MVWPIGLLFLGSLLGVSTLAATDAGFGLRLPALLAAFIMFSQAVLELTTKVRRPSGGAVRGADEVRREEPIVMSSAEVQLARSSLPASAGYPTPQEPAAARPPAGRRYVPVLMIVLALWLGIAVLYSGTDSPRLAALSTVAAFLLFAFGWLDLSGRRTGAAG